MKVAPKELQWLREYFDLYKKSLFDEEIFELLLDVKELFIKTSEKKGKVIFAANGGSAAIASHCTVDLTKNAGVRAINFNEPAMITCLSNDYGYEHWVAKALECYADPCDAVVLVSSSGCSKNIVNAAAVTKEQGLPLVTLTGFNNNNPLKQSGDINLWLDSRAYNIVEMTHHIWLLAVVDLIIGKAEYPVS